MITLLNNYKMFGNKVPMAKHGSITNFDPSHDNWNSGHGLAANDNKMDGNNKCSILLNTCGAVTYKIIRDLITPRSTDVSFTEIVNLITKHYNLSAIVQNF